jgi:hypothetical protein
MPSSPPVSRRGLLATAAGAALIPGQPVVAQQAIPSKTSGAPSMLNRPLKKPQIDADPLLSDWDFQTSGRYSVCYRALNRPRRRLGRSPGGFIPSPAIPAFGSDCKPRS